MAGNHTDTARALKAALKANRDAEPLGVSPTGLAVELGFAIRNIGIPALLAMAEAVISANSHSGRCSCKRGGVHVCSRCFDAGCQYDTKLDRCRVTGEYPAAKEPTP